MLHDCTAQLMSRLSYGFSSDSFDLKVLWQDTVLCWRKNQVPLKSLQWHKYKNLFLTRSFLLSGSHWCRLNTCTDFHRCTGFFQCVKTVGRTGTQKLQSTQLSQSQQMPGFLNCSQICSCSPSCLIFGRNINPLCRIWNYRFPLSSKIRAKIGKTPSTRFIENQPF